MWHGVRRGIISDSAQNVIKLSMMYDVIVILVNPLANFVFNPKMNLSDPTSVLFNTFSVFIEV